MYGDNIFYFLPLLFFPPSPLSLLFSLSLSLFPSLDPTHVSYEIVDDGWNVTSLLDKVADEPVESRYSALLDTGSSFFLIAFFGFERIFSFLFIFTSFFLSFFSSYFFFRCSDYWNVKL